MDMPSTIDEFQIALRDDDPPAGNQEKTKCTIGDLPNELLSYVFQIGVEIEQEEVLPENLKWKYIDDDGSMHNSSSVVIDSDSDDDEVEERLPLPSQVLVSHVCRRWRSVSINTHRFWTMLLFHLRPGLLRTKEYISRSNGLPLTIEINCCSGYIEEEEVILSLEELDQILDLLEPTSPQWGKFMFYGSYSHMLCAMSRLDKVPAAPFLQSFQVYSMWDGIDAMPLEYHASFLPFNGHAPNLKEVAFREVPIDWDGAFPNFLRGLRAFELSYPKNAWPTYATFSGITENSPELHTLILSNAGPALADGVDFNSDAAWGPVPLTIPSLTKLVLRFHDQKYAIALVRHLDLPNLTHLDLNFDTIDYSDLVQALAQPVKGRNQSLFQQLTHLEMKGLSFNSTTAKILLSELTSLRSLYLQPSRGEDEVVCDALIDPKLLPIEQAFVDLPKLFCPNLEEIATSLRDERVKALIAGRRDTGVPLKRIRRIPRMMPSLH